jgi:hypothetical protein
VILDKKHTQNNNNKQTKRKMWSTNIYLLHEINKKRKSLGLDLVVRAAHWQAKDDDMFNLQ